MSEPYEIYAAHGVWDNVGDKGGHVCSCETEEQAALIKNALNAFAVLADHLGCDPAELEGVDLTSLVILAYQSVVDADAYFKELTKEPECPWHSIRELQKILAQLPEKK